MPAACPGNPPPPAGTRIWRGAVPAPLTQWAMDLRDHVAGYPYGQTWQTTYNGQAATARKDYHTWTYRRQADGSVKLVTGICIPGITLYSPLTPGAALLPADALPVDQIPADPELAVYGADDVAGGGGGGGVDWGLVAGTGFLALGTVALFFLALHHAGRAAPRAAADNPTLCPGPDRHVGGCRPGRPLCRWRRRRRLCRCDAYHFPHRHGGGACRHGVPDAIRKSPSYRRTG